MQNEKTKSTGEEPGVSRAFIAKTAVVVFAVLVAIHTIWLLGCGVPPKQRLDGPALAAIVVALVMLLLAFQPRVLNRLNEIVVGSVRINLRHIREEQVAQAREIEDLQLILPILLPKSERQHLFNFADRQTKDYEGRSSLRAELRRLREIGLVEMVSSDKHVGHLTGGKKYDLSDYVRLTPTGEMWVRRLREVQKEKDDDVEPAKAEEVVM